MPKTTEEFGGLQSINNMIYCKEHFPGGLEGNYKVCPMCFPTELTPELKATDYFYQELHQVVLRAKRAYPDITVHAMIGSLVMTILDVSDCLRDSNRDKMEGGDNENEGSVD